MRILATALALAAFATPAMAQTEAPADAKPFQGVTVTAIAGVDHLEDGTAGTEGFLYGGAIGYDLQVSKVVLGVEGEVNGSTVKLCAGSICAKGGRDLYAGGRIGVRAGDDVLFYAKAGYTNAQIRGTSGNVTVVRENLDGFRLGAGVERSYNKFLVRAEYRYSNYELDVIRHQIVLGVGYRF